MHKYAFHAYLELYLLVIIPQIVMHEKAGLLDLCTLFDTKISSLNIIWGEHC